MKVLFGLAIAILGVLLALPPQLHQASYKYNQIDITLLYPTLIKDSDNQLRFVRTFSLTDTSDGDLPFIEPLRNTHLLCGMHVCQDFKNQVRINWLEKQKETARERQRLGELDREITVHRERREVLLASYQHGRCDAVQAGPPEPGFSCHESEFWRPLGACIGRVGGMAICNMGVGYLLGPFLPSLAANFASGQSCGAAMSKIMGEEYDFQAQIASSTVSWLASQSIKFAASAVFGVLGRTVVGVAEAGVEVAQCFPKMADRCESNYRNWLRDKEQYFDAHKEQINVCKNTMSSIQSIEQQLADLVSQHQMQQQKIQVLIAALQALEGEAIQANV